MLLNEAKEILKKNGYVISESSESAIDFIPEKFRAKVIAMAAREIGISTEEVKDFIINSDECLKDFKYMYKHRNYEISDYVSEISKIFDKVMYGDI